MAFFDFSGVDLLNGITNFGNWLTGNDQATKNYEQQEKWNQINYDEQKRVYEQNYAQQEKWNEKNFGLQTDVYNWQKQLQGQMFEREDNSIQRRVADMKAAGLNPLLAAGNGAGAGQPINVTAPQGQAPQKEAAQGKAPQRDFVPMSQMTMSAQWLQMQADIERTKAETNLINKQAEKVAGVDMPLGELDIQDKQFKVDQMNQKLLDELDTKISQGNQSIVQSKASTSNIKKDTESKQALLEYQKLKNQYETLSTGKKQAEADLTGKEIANMGAELNNLVELYNAGESIMAGKKINSTDYPMSSMIKEIKSITQALGSPLRQQKLSEITGKIRELSSRIKSYTGGK